MRHLLLPSIYPGILQCEQQENQTNEVSTEVLEFILGFRSK